MLEVTKDYISHLLEKYGNTALKIAYTYLKNNADAEDAVQDLFMKIIDKNPSFADEQHEKYWIIRTTINICKNKVGTFWQKNKCSIDEIEESAVYDTYGDTDVLKAVMSLAEKQRICIYMHYYEGYPTAEIAKITKMSDTAVRSHLHRARAKLKEILKEEYDFE